jgi:hypothetical protein
MGTSDYVLRNLSQTKMIVSLIHLTLRSHHLDYQQEIIRIGLSNLVWLIEESVYVTRWARIEI